MDFNNLKSWISENPGKTIGVVSGLVVGILIFSIGFLKTFIIILLIILGYIVGRMIDDGRPISDQISDFFNRNKML